MTNLSNIRDSLASLSIIQLDRNPVITSLSDLIGKVTDSAPVHTIYESYTTFVRALYNHGNGDLAQYIISAVTTGDNMYYRSTYQGSQIQPSLLLPALRAECAVLAKVASLSYTELTTFAGITPPLKYRSARLSAARLTSAVIEYASTKLSTDGCGIFASSHAFYLNGRTLVPVATPDPVTLQELSGYEDERRQVIDNTLALLSGKPASNILLYGDSGTGKSSTVKAIANTYFPKGLKLIELTKNQLVHIPEILDLIGGLPLKFILFIDDLSFNENDGDYAALKAILEGSIYSSYRNSVLYATSNRLHLIKEYFSDRKGDEVHFNDTISELMSLSERFGLRVTFLTPDRGQYMEIVTALHAQYQLQEPLDSVLRQAEQYAHYRGSRSPRTAKQFVRSLKSSET